MVWRGTFRNNTTELFDPTFAAVEGFFLLTTLAAQNGGRFPNTVVSTASTFIVTAPDFAGRLILTGQGLQAGLVNLGDGNSMLLPTAGQITGMTYLFNYRLRDALDSGVPANQVQPLTLPQFLAPSAQIAVNFAAAALTNAIAQSYRTDSPQPLSNFFNSDSHIYTGTNGPNGLRGFEGNDILIGLGGNDNLFGGGGNDILDGGAGSDGLQGGRGNDLYLPGPSDFQRTGVPDSVGDLGPENEIDTLSYANATGPVGISLRQDGTGTTFGWAQGLLVSGIERVIGSRFDDLIQGRFDIGGFGLIADDDTLLGNDGDDSLFGFSGNDVLIGGEGIDVLIGGPGADTAVYAGPRSQADVFFLGDGSVLVTAPGQGIDRLFGMEFLQFSNGRVSLASVSQSTQSLIVGTDGNNSRNGTSRDDLMFGLDGNDRLSGRDGNDRIEGNDGDDSISGDTGDDALWGNPGNDTMDGGLGNDTMHGGPGADRMTGDRGADQMFGDDGNDVISGDGGNDRLSGGLGADRINGGGGNDLINGGGGGDNINGGIGNDSVNGGGGNDVISGLGGRDVMNGGAGNDRMFGNNGNDVMNGAAGRDNIAGGLGNDVLSGGSGNDILSGQGGIDRLFGGLGNDRLNGNAGNDRLEGGKGDDILNGGLGADVFVFRRGDGRDVIQDFSNNVDTLVLDDAIWGGRLTPLQVLARFGENLPGNAVKLDFGNQEITIVGISSLGQLADDMQII